MTPRNPRLIFTLILCLLAGGVARAQAPASTGDQPPARPILCIEAGMHTSEIGRIDVDRAGRYLVTGSHDKTVRVWSLADGALLRIIRPPIGGGVEGSVYSVAISPDGNTVACGGVSDFAHKGVTDIYLFDRASGAMIGRISDLPEIAEDISFSTDGKYMAAGLLGASGVGVFSTKDGGLTRVDAEYGDSCYGLEWDGSGRLVTSCWDGFVRLYSAMPTLKLIAKVKAPDGAKPYGIRFSPDGSRIAVGYVDSNAVTVLSGTDLSLLYRPTVAGVGTKDDDLSTVCWSSDGKTLFAGGKASDSTNHHFIRAWTQGGQPGGSYRDTIVARETIFGLRALPVSGAADSGALVYTSAEPQWGVLDTNGAKLRIVVGAPTADYRRNMDGFQISEDGTKIDFAFEAFGKSPARLDVTERTVYVGGDIAKQALGAIHAKMTAPLLDAPGLMFGLIDTHHITLNGVALALDRNDSIIGGLAIAPDRKSFLLGSAFNLNCFGADGKVRWKTPVSSALWGVNVAGSGAVAIAASSDGTIRWYRMRDGKELLDFFPHADTKRWVLWTPDGYYDCSPGGEDLIGWNVNHGKDQAADFYPASRFRDTYYRPDVIQQMLKSLDPAEALRIANLNAGRTSPAAPANVETHLPPVVTILSPADESQETDGKVTIRYTVRSPNGSPVTGVRALVDGRPVEQARGLDFGAVGAPPNPS